MVKEAQLNLLITYDVTTDSRQEPAWKAGDLLCAAIAALVVYQDNPSLVFVFPLRNNHFVTIDEFLFADHEFMRKIVILTNVFE